jgi:hypothetical protein
VAVRVFPIRIVTHIDTLPVGVVVGHGLLVKLLEVDLVLVKATEDGIRR